MLRVLQAFISNLIVLNRGDEGGGAFLFLDGGKPVNGLHKLIFVSYFL